MSIQSDFSHLYLHAVRERELAERAARDDRPEPAAAPTGTRPRASRARGRRARATQPAWLRMAR
jgi:hypothetical protein